jgi:hypothetical protein
VYSKELRNSSLVLAKMSRCTLWPESRLSVSNSFQWFDTTIHWLTFGLLPLINHRTARRLIFMEPSAACHCTLSVEWFT